MKHVSVNRVIRILLLFIFTANVGEALFVPVFAIFVTDIVQGATFSTIGLAVAFSAVAKSVCQVPLARYLDKRRGEHDDFWAMIAGSLLATLASFSLLIISLPWHLYLVNVVVGISSAALMAAYYAVFAHHADKGSEGLEWSLFSVVGLTVSTALGAAIGGYIADLFGIRVLIVAVGMMNVAATFVLVSLYPFLLVRTQPILKK
jgi:MFS family permease